MGKNDLHYHVDMVLCIDCTESMDNILNIVKTRALGFYDDIQKKMVEKGKRIDQLRVKVIGFRDYQAYDEEVRNKTHSNEPMLVSDFFVLPEEAHKFEISVKSLQPVGGGDDEEDGLEALAYAIRSDWDKSEYALGRHVVVLWTDQPPHALGTNASSGKYPKGMAKDFRELSAWWGDEIRHGVMDQYAKRLVLFAPEEGAWKTISDNWEMVVHHPSKAGDHLMELDYNAILDFLAYSI